MRLVTLLLFFFGITQTGAYSEPGGYERVLLYYLYSIDAQLNGGTPKQIATGCKGTRGSPCTLDQLLRYLAKEPEKLPTRAAPATSYPTLPNMDQTAQGLAIKDSEGRDFAGPIKLGPALPGFNGAKYSDFLFKLGWIAIDLAIRSPGNANLLKTNIQAVRTMRRNAMMTTFTGNPDNSDIHVVTTSIPLYDGAAPALTVNVADAPATVAANQGLTVKDFKKRWLKNSEGGHVDNVAQLKQVLDNMEMAC
ncbi:hypothetical protein BGW36DRAFT_382707 [Talaromyces proteolyticus]|uniref:Heme haloperoxidase family profile domain-containing protein n=1 Tax=Talaromyces proteolyticus TaxID=1131652 RepID=A0AAD4KMP6_9EURO|nr:uncharacterized protein BGW36DRAFT_382707 [Talaromyces proteolyticus]KAH8695445.1 hypothetical protein BGW36DRAFT_382707 [Talaromyces proteolyticus]